MKEKLKNGHNYPLHHKHLVEHSRYMPAGAMGEKACYAVPTMDHSDILMDEDIGQLMVKLIDFKSQGQILREHLDWIEKLEGKQPHDRSR
jgi:hypothetical protein